MTPCPPNNPLAMPPLPLEIRPAPYEDQTRTLNADEAAVLKKELSEELFGLKALLDHFTPAAAVDLNMVHTVFSVGEHRRARLCKMLGIEMDSVTEQEARYAQLRKANELIRDLESQLGQGATPEACSAFMKNLSEKLEYWWDVHGFGHIREMRFTKWGGMEVEFSCSLFGTFSLTMSDTPVSDKEARKQWLAALSERGFVTKDKERGNDPCLVDCDQTRETLKKLFSEHFPGARISSTDNHFENGVPTLRGVKVYFQNLVEVHALPDMPKEAG